MTTKPDPYKQGWFDGRTMVGDTWGRKWHYLTREHQWTFWSACGPLWLASTPGSPLLEAPCAGPVCRKCLLSLESKAIHFKDGSVRSACGIRPDDRQSTSRKANVTCKRCLAQLK